MNQNGNQVILESKNENQPSWMVKDTMDMIYVFTGKVRLDMLSLRLALYLTGGASFEKGQ